MAIKYKVKSGRAFTYEELKKKYLENHADRNENDFEWDLFFAIEVYKSVKTIAE